MAVKWEIPLITRNVSQGVPAYEDPPTKERFLTQEETQRLFEAVLLSENTMLRYIVPMLILTGARKHEVLEARWEDFDTDSHQWRIPKTKSGKPRYVPLSDSVIELLEAIPRHEESEWIFTNPKTNKPYTRFYKSWDRARRIANLADVRIHDLRHSFASFLVNSGRSIYEVQKILGHSDVRVTQRYAHLSQNTLTDAANKVGEILNFKF
jgi:integrase